MPVMTQATRFSQLSAPRQTLVRLLQSMNFGSLECLEIRSGEPVFNTEGTVFVKLLRAGGTLRSAGNEMVVLRLAERLREWAGLPGEPIQLAKASGRWTAVFACASAAGNA